MLDDELTRVLTEYGWLSRMPAEFRNAVISACRPVRRAAGEPIYHAGDLTGGLFGVCRGAVALIAPQAGSEMIVVHLSTPGSWIGEGSLLADDGRRVGAVARTDVMLAALPAAALNQMVGNRPEWWRHIGALATVSTDIAVGGGMDLLIRDNERRCIAVLLRLCGVRYGDAPGGLLLDAPVTQDELAALTHVSRNAAGAILRRLADQNLIELGYRSIHLNEPDVLRRMVDRPRET